MTANLPFTDAGFEDVLVRGILSSIRDGIYALDDSGRIIWVNGSATTEFDLGYTHDELVDEHVSLLLSDDDIEQCATLIGELLEDPARDSARCTVALQTKHGTSIPVELHLAVVRSEEGEFRGTVGVVRDITKRRQREQRLMVLTRLLRHNLRNKANVIAGRLELLERGMAVEDSKNLEAVRDACRELNDISEKTLEVHRTLMETGGPTEVVDAAALVREVADRSRDEFPGAEIAVTAPPTARVRADDTLGVVLENLIENAVEHAESDLPSIEVSVQFRETEAAEQVVAIRVADDGPGIPAGEVAPLTSGEETPLLHGSGLGLWLVKWVIEGFGGDIDFRAGSPSGSEITCRLQPARSTGSR